MERLKPKLLLRSRMMTEWWTRCMSGVTMRSRTIRSSARGSRRLLWLNMAVLFRMISKRMTARAGGPKR